MQSNLAALLCCLTSFIVTIAEGQGKKSTDTQMLNNHQIYDPHQMAAVVAPRPPQQNNNQQIKKPTPHQLESNRDDYDQLSPQAVNFFQNYLTQINTPTKLQPIHPRKTRQLSNLIDTQPARYALGAVQFTPNNSISQLLGQHDLVPYGPFTPNPNFMLTNRAVASQTPVENYAIFRSEPAPTDRQRAAENFFPTSFDSSPHADFSNQPILQSQINKPLPVLGSTGNKKIITNMESKKKSWQPRTSVGVPYSSMSLRIDKPIQLAVRPSASDLHVDRNASEHQSADQQRHKTEQKKLLSDQQLMSLIEEIKEFNRKQSSRLQSLTPVIEEETPVESLKKAPIDNGQSEESSASSSSSPSAAADEKEEFQDDSATVSEPEKSDADGRGKMNTDELAKFAKFLMSKEGANLKFQLGLDRDSPDDGDDDDERDSLLESPKKSPPEKLPEYLVSKHDELVKQMNDINDRISRKSTAKSRDDDYDRARKRRDQNAGHASASELPSSNKKLKRRSNVADYNASGNFAKALIEQEIFEDKLDADRRYQGGDDLDERNIMRDPTQHEVERASSEPTTTQFEIDGGTAKEAYLPGERHDDTFNINQALEMARGSKSRVRSRMKTPLESLLKNALDGRLGIKATRDGDGKLLIKGNNGSSMRLELPNDSRTSTLTSDKEVVPKNSELAISQVEPDAKSNDNIKTIKIQHGKPLHNEYPVSERVSDRLGKLSRNLDRYFNDGFLKEIESKSSLEGDSANKPDQADYHQPQTSASSRSKSGPLKPKVAVLNDRDFDVNVGVDGKRDRDSDTDDYADDETDRGERPTTARRKDNSRQAASRAAGKKRPGRSMISAARKSVQKKSTLPNSVVEKIRKVELPRKGEDEVENIQKDIAVGRQNIEFEASGRLIPSLDPVEMESLETPIGPDNDSSEPNLAQMDKVKVTSGESSSSSRSKNRTKDGKKFYSEPEEWH